MADMSALNIGVFFFFLLQMSALGEDTVAEDIDVHQLERLVAMLTSKECEDLLSVLSHPEESIFEHLGRLSPEKNQLGLKPRAKRDTSSASVKNNEVQCHTALKDWLLRYGEETDYDRLSRALQHIGRTDIANEMGKNINQDKALNMKRYVEDYHKYVSSLNFPSDTKAHQRVREKTVGELTRRDPDVIAERARVPLYQKGPLDAALLLLYGLLLGFGGPFLAAATFIALHICLRRPQNCHYTRSCSCKTCFDHKVIKLV